MDTVIGEEEFSRYFDLAISLWPSQLTLDSAANSAADILDDSWLQNTYLAIRAELCGAVEDWDLQVSSAITAGIYKYLCDKAEHLMGVKVSRECVDKYAVMDIVDHYENWKVLRKETC